MRLYYIMPLYGQTIMPCIRLETSINAPIETVFDLARDLDVHSQTVPQTRERAWGSSDGRLVGPGDRLTFEATHFGVRQRLVSQVTAFERPTLFADEMLQGTFRSLRHTHTFQSTPDGGTLMCDILEFTSPLGLLGRLADFLFLTRYMERFLRTRNAHLKRIAEETTAP
jgi:ligand-binding SRPBCC domain-containing protein